MDDITRSATIAKSFLDLVVEREKKRKELEDLDFQIRAAVQQHPFLATIHTSLQGSTQIERRSKPIKIKPVERKKEKTKIEKEGKKRLRKIFKN